MASQEGKHLDRSPTTREAATTEAKPSKFFSFDGMGAAKPVNLTPLISSGQELQEPVEASLVRVVVSKAELTPLWKNSTSPCRLTSACGPKT